MAFQRAWRPGGKRGLAGVGAGFGVRRREAQKPLAAIRRPCDIFSDLFGPGAFGAHLPRDRIGATFAPRSTSISLDSINVAAHFPAEGAHWTSPFRQVLRNRARCCG